MIQDEPAFGQRARRWHLAAPTVPAWVETLVSSGDSSCLVTEGFGDALGMDIVTFQQRVAEAYRSVFRRLSNRKACHAVRFWAFVPGIHEELAPGINRYMAFNAARYNAYEARFGGPSSIGGPTPTASAVGVMSGKFTLHCLAVDQPGKAVENPRQTPAYHYSRRHGPLPPCFARATLVPGQSPDRYLLVGGTASIIGEDSRHTDRLEEQFHETIRNLSHLVGAAADRSPSEETPLEGLIPLLAAFRDIRVYYPRETDSAVLAALIEATFLPETRVEFVLAALCRPELLVEIEGLAQC